MRAGALKSRISFYEKTHTTNAMHESVAGWKLYRTVHARKRPVSSADSMQAQALVGAVMVQFEIRYDRNARIAPEMVIRDDVGDWYDIQSPLQQDYSRRSLLITGKQRVKPPEVLPNGI